MKVILVDSPIDDLIPSGNLESIKLPLNKASFILRYCTSSRRRQQDSCCVGAVFVPHLRLQGQIHMRRFLISGLFLDPVPDIASIVLAASSSTRLLAPLPHHPNATATMRFLPTALTLAALSALSIAKITLDPVDVKHLAVGDSYTVEWSADNDYVRSADANSISHSNESNRGEPNIGLIYLDQRRAPPGAKDILRLARRPRVLLRPRLRRGRR